jgi:hypothetical protein
MPDTVGEEPYPRNLNSQALLGKCPEPAERDIVRWETNSVRIWARKVSILTGVTSLLLGVGAAIFLYWFLADGHDWASLVADFLSAVTPIAVYAFVASHSMVRRGVQRLGFASAGIHLDRGPGASGETRRYIPWIDLREMSTKRLIMSSIVVLKTSSGEAVLSDLEPRLAEGLRTEWTTWVRNRAARAVAVRRAGLGDLGVQQSNDPKLTE